MVAIKVHFIAKGNGILNIKITANFSVFFVVFSYSMLLQNYILYFVAE